MATTAEPMSVRQIMDRAGGPTAFALEYLRSFIEPEREPRGPRGEDPLIRPAGWPPGEDVACVVDQNGVREAGSSRGSSITPMVREYMRANGIPDGWRCCTCGTHNPSDPCIPGAYF